jgi:hypothetical protein
MKQIAFLWKVFWADRQDEGFLLSEPPQINWWYADQQADSFAKRSYLNGNRNNYVDGKGGYKS